MRARSLHEVSPRSWYLIFADLLTLLITFFVLRLSMTSVDLQQVVDMLRTAEPGGQEIAGLLREGLTENLGDGTDQKGLTSFENSFTLKDQPQGALLSLGAGTFSPGSDLLSPKTKVVIQSVAAALHGRDVQIKIAGHTDDQPISSYKFPSNWELSGARAIAVAKELIKHGIPPERVSAVGYADVKPISGNDTEEGRRQNRRVEIYFNNPPSKSKNSRE